MIPEDSIRRLKDAVPLLPEVTARLQLRKSGPSSWVGLCCFHRESAPSLTIHDRSSQRPDVFHCFGCSAGGDVIDFVALYEAIPKIKAILLLAKQYGVSLDSPRQSRPASRYLAELREHAEFWWIERRALLVSLLEDACAEFFTASESGINAEPAKDWALTCGRMLRRVNSITPEARGDIFLRLRTEVDVRRWRSSVKSLQWLNGLPETHPDEITQLIDFWAEKVM